MSSSCAFRAAISRTHGHTKHAVHSGASTHPVACDPAGAHRRPWEKLAAPREVKIKGDTKLVITEKSKRTLDRKRSEGAALSTDEAAAAAAPAEALEEDAA